MMLDEYCWFLRSGLDDVRWEKVEHIKRSLAVGTYAVPAKRVAARLFRHMLERDPATVPLGNRIK
jgi:anti-sigma28 factor (negative regulator of flagellin synthesis)